MAVRDLDELDAMLDRFSDECNLADVDIAETCTECGEGLMLPDGRTYEDSDADGRRGRWMRWWCCNECGNTEGSYE